MRAAGLGNHSFLSDIPDSGTMAQTTRGRDIPSAVGPITETPPVLSLSSRDNSLMICEVLKELVNNLLQVMLRRGPVSTLGPLVNQPYRLLEEAHTLTSLCGQWVDGDQRTRSTLLADLIRKATDYSEGVRCHVISLVNALDNRNREQVINSGQQLTLAVSNLTQICGEVTLAAGYVASRHGLLDCGDYMKIHFKVNVGKLPEVGIGVIEHFMTGCIASVAQTFEDSIICLAVCEQKTVLAQQQGPLISQYSQVLKQLRLVLFKTLELLQSMMNGGVVRIASNALRRPLQFYETMFWRFQMIISRLKVIVETANAVVDVAEALVRGSTIARKRLTHLSKLIVCLAEHLLLLHKIELPSIVRKRREAAAASDDHVASLHMTMVENFTLLTEFQMQDLRHGLDEVGNAAHKLVGYLNKFKGVN